MCGIAGFWTPGGLDRDAPATVRRMTDVLVHRGPDDSGHWLDAEAGIALGHRRLSILDLSAEGHQPMTSQADRYVIVYNGEVYNFAELRADLEAAGVSFRGHSDTEVMLAAIERWGLSAAVARMAGMFAFALWDRAERRLHLVRDRFGEKPLYYGWVGRTLLFGSELKALRAHPAWQGSLDRGALALFLRHSYVPAPWSIYEGIRKLEPGTIGTATADGSWTTEPYWSMDDVVRRGHADPIDASDAEVVDELARVLGPTIRDQMIADVPLGAFLSGGVDSSTIVALMQAQSTRRVRTFTIGFEEPGYNEADHAKAVAAHLGTDHTELYVTPTEARAVIPRLPALYDEPFADSSQIPTFLVAGLARRHVTVALSGDGGDELFAGYDRYALGDRLWGGLRTIPGPVRHALASAIRAVPTSTWGTVLDGAQAVLPRRRRIAHAGDRIHKLASVIDSRSGDLMYRQLVSHWHAPETVALDAVERGTVLTNDESANGGSFVERMMYLDARSYLPDDLMVKVDRAAMGVSLESRAPFLDHRVVEFGWRVPMAQKRRNGQGKWILRELLYRHVPRALIERPKMGFGVPIDSWLRGPLAEWAGDLLSPDRLRREGFLRPESVTRKWTEHTDKTRNWQYALWAVLMFEAWLEAQA